MRIALVLPDLPLPFGSASARWYYVLLRGLVERGHTVSALAAASRPEQIAEAEALFPAPDYRLRCFPFPQRPVWRSKLATLRRPYGYMFGPELRRAVARERAAGVDVLHLEQLWTGWLGVADPARALVNVHHLYRVDLEQVPPRGARGHLERRLLLGTERRLLRRFPRLLTVSPRLARAVGELHPRAAVHPVPITLDLARYAVQPDPPDPIVTVIGNMRWAPSRAAAERLLGRLFPAIRAQVPAARARVVGWSARQELRAHLDRPGVEVLQDVPEIAPHFAASQVMLYAPGRGSGVKVKLLEALAYGVPVVTNAEGAEGIPGADGVHFDLAEDDAGLVAKAVALLRDPALRAARRRAGRALLEERLNPARCLDQLEAAYAQVPR